MLRTADKLRAGSGVAENVGLDVSERQVQHVPFEEIRRKICPKLLFEGLLPLFGAVSEILRAGG